MDTNYQVGIPWTRAPQFRVLYHPSDIVSIGFALETAEQYGGGSSGGGSIVLPSALLHALYQYADRPGRRHLHSAEPDPDIQAKIAFDPKVNGNLLHIEFGGVLSSFKTYNPLTSKALRNPAPAARPTSTWNWSRAFT
jgi:hypothetical protein